MKRRFMLCFSHQMLFRRSNQGELDGWVCSTYGEQERGIEGLGRRREGRRPLGRLRDRWEDNIKIGLQEVEWGSLEWIAVSQDRDRVWALVKVVMNLRVP
jgi:hypothetical protein